MKTDIRKQQVAAAKAANIKPFHLAAKLGAWFRLLAISSDGSERVLSDWSPNLITDGGLNRYNVSSWGGTCVVGSGNTAPANTDTQLATLVASTTTIQSNTTGASSLAGSPTVYYAHRRIRYRFNAGVAAGNLSEVGVGWASTTLFSRALILDGGGSPTTITVAGDEVLDVEYELRAYPAETDSTFSVIDSITAISHACVARPATVATASQWAPLNYNDTPSASTSSSIAYDGSIGTETSSPSGTGQTSTSTTIGSYSNLSYERTYTATWGLDAGNIGGISALLLRANYSSGGGAWQIDINPPIDKDNTKSLSINWKFSWSRAT